MFQEQKNENAVAEPSFLSKGRANGRVRNHPLNSFLFVAGRQCSDSKAALRATFRGIPVFVRHVVAS
jgi:hypothetical protein